MNVSELRIAKAVIERERENETAEVRILFGESVDATTRQFFFLFCRPKVTRVTRVRSNDVCSSRELVFWGNYYPTVFGNWTNLKNVPRDLVIITHELARF